MPGSIFANKFVSVASQAVGASAALWTPAAANKSIRLLGITWSLSAAATMVLQSGVGGATVFQLPASLVATPMELDLSMTQGILLPPNTALAGLSSAAANFTGTLWGVEE